MKRMEFQVISLTSSIHLRSSALSAVDFSSIPPSQSPHLPHPRFDGDPQTKPTAKYQTNPVAISGGWVEKAGETSREAASQTNPLARYDVLSSEIVDTSVGWAFPERSQFGWLRLPQTKPTTNYQTKPMAISGGWVEKAGETSREAASQTNPLVRYDVLGSEIVDTSVG
jgi:hypothetical protein